MIESPDFPDKYPHNLECSYIIIAPPQTEVTLTFKTFDLENDPLLMTEAECKYDWLEVWDGLPQGELLNEYHSWCRDDDGLARAPPKMFPVIGHHA